MKRLNAIVAALLFVPCLIVGYLIECAKPGFNTGREIAGTEE